MGAVVKAEAVQIAPAAKLKAARQILEPAKPLLEMVRPFRRFGVVVLLIGAEAFEILVHPSGHAKLEALDRPAVHAGIVMTYLRQLTRRGAPIDGLEMKVRRQDAADADIRARQPVRFFGGCGLCAGRGLG